MDRFANGDWLDRSVLRIVAGSLGAISLGLIGYTLATRTGTLDRWGRPIGTDFSLIWSAGRMALAGHAADVYDWAAHFAAQKATHGGAAVGFAGWHYPPPFLLVAAGLATLPYLPALVVWQGATLGAALAVALRICPGRDTLLAALAFPAVFVCLGHGHNGFLSATLLAGGLLLLERRPILAGALLGCLVYKPQLALLVPLALGVGRHWRALGGAANSAALLFVLSIVCFGWEPWFAFRVTLELTRRVVVEDGGTGWYKIVSAFSFVRMSGGSVGAAYAVQGVVAGAVAAGVAWLWWSGASLPLRAASLLVGALLATPYVLDYDTVLLGPALAFLAAHGLRHGFLRWEKTAMAFAWFVPLAARHLAFFAGLPGTFLAMAWLFGLVLRRAVADRRKESAEPAAAIRSAASSR